MTVSSSARTGCGRSLGSMQSIERAITSRVADQLATRPRIATLWASCCPIAHAQSRPTTIQSHNLRSHFVIRLRCDPFSLVDFLANERELTGKTFTTPLTSPNPNILPGAVLVLLPHRLHLSYMHPVKSKNQFHCTRLYM